MNNLFCSIIVVCLLLSGCRKQETPTVLKTQADSSEKNSSIVNQPATDHKKHTNIDDHSYRPIFKSGLDRDTINDRMEKNFTQYHNRIEKSGLRHFPSAGLLIYQPSGSSKPHMRTGYEFDASSTAGLRILTNPFSIDDTVHNLIGKAGLPNIPGLLFTKKITVDGKTGIFCAQRTKIKNSEIAKFITAFGSDNFSWIVTGSFSPKEEADFGELLLKSLLNARISGQPRLPPGEDVDFTMRANELVLTDGFLDRVVFTINGVFPGDSVDEPIFQAFRTGADFPSDNKLKIAEFLARPGAGFMINMISTTSEVTIDGLKGYELVAIGKVVPNDEPLKIYSVSLFDNQSVYVMQGWVSAENPNDYIRDFRSLANSFERKKQVKQPEN